MEAKDGVILAEMFITTPINIYGRDDEASCEANFEEYISLI